MKSYRKGYEITRDEVEAAYLAWADAGSGRRNAWRVAEEHGSAAALVDEIHSEVRARSLSLRPIHRYTRKEGAKLRLIGVESVKQQVCDYLAVRALEPLLETRVGHWQVASNPGMGQLSACRAVSRWVHEGGYHVHLDVTKCYQSIRHDVVMGIVRKHIRSPDAVWLVGALLATYGEGLEIGSYLSLRLAQLVLSYGYHHVESLGKVRRGRRSALVTHQLWYADDVWLFSRDKRDLRSAARSLERYMARDLGLSVKPWKVCRVSEAEPVDVVGYRVFPGHVELRRKLFLRARRSYRRFDRLGGTSRARRAVSYYGWLASANCRRFMERERIPQIKARASATVARAERSSSGHRDHVS